MALQPANHYVITGKGVDAVIDTAGITGNPAVSLTVNLVDDGLDDHVAGFATLTRTLTSFGGPRLVTGPLQLYELRPVAGTATTANS